MSLLDLKNTKKGLQRLYLMGSLILILMGLGGYLVSNIFLKPLKDEAQASDLEPEIILNLINQERQKNGLANLISDQRATAAATTKALDMAQNGYFAHYSPSGKRGISYLKDSGFDYQIAAENLAVQFSSSTSLVKAWMKSSSHKKNILEPGFKSTGIGISKGLFEGKSTFYIAQMFATEFPREGIKPTPTPPTKPQEPVVEPKAELQKPPLNSSDIPPQSSSSAVTTPPPKTEEQLKQERKESFEKYLESQRQITEETFTKLLENL